MLNEAISTLRWTLGGDLMAVVLFGSRARKEARRGMIRTKASEARMETEHDQLRGL